MSEPRPIEEILDATVQGAHVPALHGDPRRVGVVDRWSWSCRCGAGSPRSDMTIAEAQSNHRFHVALAEANDRAVSYDYDRKDARAEVDRLRSELSALRARVEELTRERDEVRSQLAEIRKRSEVTRAWITATCIANRGRHGAVEEALQRLRQNAHDVFDGWGERFRGDAKLHFVLQIERPTEER